MKTTEIKTEFKVGDKVWIIYEHQRDDRVECPGCHGQIIQKIKGHPFACHTCRYGWVYKPGPVLYDIDTGVIVQVFVEINKEGFDVSYRVGESADSDGGTLYDGEKIENMYASKKQAQREIERRKKK
jgi:hypothetical protein